MQNKKKLTRLHLEDLNLNLSVLITCVGTTLLADKFFLFRSAFCMSSHRDFLSSLLYLWCRMFNVVTYDRTSHNSWLVNRPI